MSVEPGPLTVTLPSEPASCPTTTHLPVTSAKFSMVRLPVPHIVANAQILRRGNEPTVARCADLDAVHIRLDDASVSHGHRAEAVVTDTHFCRRYHY